MASVKYWLWLSTLHGVSRRMKLALLEHFRDPEAVYFAAPEEYLLVEGITKAAAKALENRDLDTAGEILSRCDELGLRVLTMQDTDYPDRLRNIYDPPLVLYVQGRMPRFDDEVAIAVVGTRRATGYALACGEKLCFQMAAHGAVVVSGLASGADAVAHRGALRAGGATVGVIAGGHDIIYPRENRGLYEDLALRGAILSEHPPGTAHRKEHFPARNRIISGLCLGVLVLEAPERSGALITAGRALDQGRDVFAVPGPIDDWHCAGSNKLLRDGAGVVTDAWDILGHYVHLYPHRIRHLRAAEPTVFGAQPPQPPQAVEREEERKEPEKTLPVLDMSRDNGLTDDQIRIVRTLEGNTMQVDDIIDLTQIPARRVLSALTVLEIDRIVTQESGKRFALAVTLQ